MHIVLKLKNIKGPKDLSYKVKASLLGVVFFLVCIFELKF